MRTVRSSSRLLRREVCVCLVGCLSSGNVCLPGGCLPRGSAEWGCVSAWGGVCLPGGSAHGGCLPGVCVYPSMHWGRHSPLWTEWLTDRCKNIAFLQLRLRMVIIGITWEILDLPMCHDVILSRCCRSLNYTFSVCEPAQKSCCRKVMFSQPSVCQGRGGGI